MIFNQKILSLEALRGIAALLVLLFHASQAVDIFTQTETKIFKNFFSLGTKGVDLFFVLSGFIIFFVHHQDINTPSQIGRYAWRRFSRIYPTYWIACIFALTFYALQGRVNDEEFNFQNILHSFMLFPFEMKRLIAVSWTLMFEVIFYVLFGLLILNRLVGQIVLIAWVIMIISTQLIDIQFPPHWEYLFAGKNLEFFFGILSAKYLIHNRSKFPLTTACFGISLFLGFAIAEVYSPYLQLHLNDLTSSIIYGLSGGLVIIGLVSKELHQKIFIFPMFTFLGEASYSIYLIHVPVLLFFFKFTQAFQLTILFPKEFLFLFSSAFALSLGILFYYLIEKPLRNSLTKLQKKHAIQQIRV